MEKIQFFQRLSKEIDVYMIEIEPKPFDAVGWIP